MGWHLPIRRPAWLCTAAIAALLLPADGVLAFNPPVDRVGSLTVRIVGPEETVTRVDEPLDIQVVVVNGGDQPARCTIRLGLIDGWRSEPAGAVPLAVAAKSQADCHFRVTVASDSYSGHYPIHAYATLDAEGPPRTAHPILVLETKLAAPPRAVGSPAWEPLLLTAPRTLAIWQVPVYRAVVAVFGQPPQIMPVGWSGEAEGNRASFTVSTAQRLGDVSRQVSPIRKRSPFMPTGGRSGRGSTKGVGPSRIGSERIAWATTCSRI